MSAKRPERKESGERAVHLRPRLKRKFWKRNRQRVRAAIQEATCR